MKNQFDLTMTEFRLQINSAVILEAMHTWSFLLFCIVSKHDPRNNQSCAFTSNIRPKNIILCCPSTVTTGNQGRSVGILLLLL